LNNANDTVMSIVVRDADQAIAVPSRRSGALNGAFCE
jgi:hypothetical protein